MEHSQALPGRGALSPAIQKTLANTFWTVGGMLAILAVSSVASMGLKLGLGMTLGLLAVSIGLIFATNAYKNSPFGLVLIAAFAGLQGVVLGPLLTHYLAMANGAFIVGSAAAMTALATFTCATYAITSRRSFSQFRGFLLGGTIVLIVASLISMFFPIPLLHVTISAVGALLFLGWLLYDVSSIVTGEETNYITASLGIFLDILNLFVHLLRIMGFLSSDD